MESNISLIFIISASKTSSQKKKIDKKDSLVEQLAVCFFFITEKAKSLLILPWTKWSVRNSFMSQHSIRTVESCRMCLDGCLSKCQEAASSLELCCSGTGIFLFQYKSDCVKLTFLNQKYLSFRHYICFRFSEILSNKIWYSGTHVWFILMDHFYILKFIFPLDNELQFF